ncbi:hypothetical protein [Actinoplanes sp. NPDC051411]|uniref:hypothetical protein n=1 Tax=Actinoplanes sp. NPDC051411 TaxID=3155522 RepID=UPI0034341CE1
MNSSPASGYETEESEWRADAKRYGSLIGDVELRGCDIPDNEDASALVTAGALVLASTMFIDELLDDIRLLAEVGGTVADHDGSFLALEELPPQLAHHYDGRFARKFLIAAVGVTKGLTAARWRPPACVAEALAMHVIVARTTDLLLDHGVLNDQQAKNLGAQFQDVIFDDTDFEFLYRPEAEDEANQHADVWRSVSVQSWFQPASTEGIHPFLVDTP